MIPLVIGITLISFAAMQAAPGDYLTTLQTNPRISQGTIEKMRKQYGLIENPRFSDYVKMYGRWLWNAAHGNFGMSFVHNRPVFELIGDYVYYTFLLSFWALLFSWSVAIPLGVFIATHRNSMWDRAANFFVFGGISLPAFFLALLAMMFAAKAGWFPVGGATSVNYAQLAWLGKIADTGRHLFLPVLVLGIGNVAGLMRQMRGNLLDVLGENYILAARARGLPERRVIYKHAVRNAINPLITVFGHSLGGLLAGAALVENVMSWPGLGQLLLKSIYARDVNMMMGDFVMIAVLLILGNLVADILLLFTDPRTEMQ
jgi:peptide/nickel transport system permease protein